MAIRWMEVENWRGIMLRLALVGIKTIAAVVTAITLFSAAHAAGVPKEVAVAYGDLDLGTAPAGPN